MRYGRGNKSMETNGICQDNDERVINEMKFIMPHGALIMIQGILLKGKMAEADGVVASDTTIITKSN
ncbi:hypothetical protein C5167_008598 [Papaver somniferum]|uniref:Uncharacterized protein n=1 Tax=Papaver somniferum TaxID=3469 RepID=A0A4Y7JYY9_PAPSO|nr:hypothetical protein C5167_008598 [Papaver somniferum]